MKNYKKKCVSIIIPVYNVESYLKECLQSVVLQTYPNIEIIIIDDGSTDKSQLICEEFREKDERIKIISQPNAGVSVARNKGISVATGQYIAFVDSDDVISNCYIEELVKVIEEENVSMAMISYSSDINSLDSIDTAKKDVIRYKSSYLFDSMLSLQGSDEKVCNGYLWNKIFKMDVIKKNNIQFPCGIEIWEDMYFVMRYLQCIEECIYINKILYYYRSREDSAVKQMTISKLKSKVKVSKMFVDLEGGQKLKEEAERLYYDTIIDYSFRCIYQKDDENITDDLLKEIDEKHIWKTYSLKRKIKLVIIKVCKLI